MNKKTMFLMKTLKLGAEGLMKNIKAKIKKK